MFGMRSERRSYRTCEGHKPVNEASDGFKSCHESIHDLLKEQSGKRGRGNKLDGSVFLLEKATDFLTTEIPLECSFLRLSSSLPGTI